MTPLALTSGIPWGSFLSSPAEWHYFAGGLALGFILGLYAEHRAKHRWRQPSEESD